MSLRKLDHLKPSGQVVPSPLVHLGDDRVPDVQRAVHALGNLLHVPLVGFLDVHHGKEVVVRVPERDTAVQRSPFFLVEWEA